MKRPYLFLVLLMPLLWQCNRNTYNSTNFPEDYLEFGKGGGLTGEVTSYYLLPNGQLFSHSSLAKDTLAYGRLPKRTSEELLEQFSAAGLDTVHFNHPGNIYSFLKQHSATGIHSLIWGSTETVAPSEAKKYYESLISALATIKATDKQ